MDYKPLVTCAGDEKLFISIRKFITEGLPRESVEWKRSHIRNSKVVYVSANFVSFSEDRLPAEGSKNLLGQAFFHTYWTECQDIDIYKQSVKESITTWLNKLKCKKIYDWLIVVVDHSDSKKSSKSKLLPRTSVLDKIKSDFPSQGSQRCLTLLDPSRNDTRAAESMNALLQRIRILVLQSYSRQLSLFEEHMRTQRERRNESGWCFQDFFFLQEELAFVMEMLGLYDEALVQYDELDALFTQFVINSNVGDMPDWLSSYSQQCDMWSGLCLLREKSFEIRKILLSGNASLLDLRNYLFSRQCSLLLMLCRPWEVAQRTLPFLHNCISELKILEITMSPGSIACWVFLSCFEVLQTCEKFSDTSQIKEYSLYCAGLWAYSREKLHHLGILCGLMPDLEANSEKLHIVVSLLAGMGEDPYGVKSESPHAKLRSSLSSKESFLKQYLELSELTMGTFKHNRRIRTARLIGKDLAQFYLKMKQPQKAVSFLTDLLKTYREENWEILIADIQKELLQCYLDMDDIPRYLKTCIRLATTFCLNLDQRKDYFQEIISSSEKLGSDPLLLRTEKSFLVIGAKIDSTVNPIIKGSSLSIIFYITSNLPSEIICRNVRLLLRKQAILTSDKSKVSETGPYLSSKTKISATHSPVSPILSGELGIPSRDEMQQRILVQPHIVLSSYQQEGNRIYSVMCKNTHQVLRRRDSQGFHKDDIMEEENGPACKISMVKIVPGSNVLTIPVKASDAGMYSFHRLWMEWGNIHFALSSLLPLFSFTVIEEMPTITRKHIAVQCDNKNNSDEEVCNEKHDGDLIAGIEQELVLSILSGSSNFDGNTTVHIRGSRGLKFKDSNSTEWVDGIEVSLLEMQPFTSSDISVKTISQFVAQKNNNSIEQFVTLQCPWSSSPQRLSLHFMPPFFVSHKLYTCGIRKYIQVTAHGTTSLHQFLMKNAELKSVDPSEVLLKELPSSDNMIIHAGITGSYVWEVITEDPNALPLHFNFTVDFALNAKENQQSFLFSYEFKLNSYETLYSIRAKIEPPKGSEFCRVGIMCFLHISISQIHQTSYTSLMYEVVVDQTMWAVCGRTAGVVNIDESKKHGVTLDIMPLISGFLPLPTIRLSKYIPAKQKKPVSKDSTPSKDASYSTARLEPFDTGQIYSWSRSYQVHVLPASNSLSLDVYS